MLKPNQEDYPDYCLKNQCPLPLSTEDSQNNENNAFQTLQLSSASLGGPHQWTLILTPCSLEVGELAPLLWLMLSPRRFYLTPGFN